MGKKLVLSDSGSTGKDGGIDRIASLSHTTKRRITTNLKTIKKQKCQKIKLHETPTFAQTNRRGRARWRGFRERLQTTWAKLGCLNKKLKTHSYV